MSTPSRQSKGLVSWRLKGVLKLYFFLYISSSNWKRSRLPKWITDKKLQMWHGRTYVSVGPLIGLNWTDKKWNSVVKEARFIGFIHRAEQVIAWRSNIYGQTLAGVYKRVIPSAHVSGVFILLTCQSFQYSLLERQAKEKHAVRSCKAP